MSGRTCLSDRGDRLEWIATAYGLRDFAVCLCFLRAHGILVAGEPWHATANLPHCTGAMGGIPVRVPARQAIRARALLGWVESEPQDAARPSLGFKILVAAIFIGLLGFAAAPPSSGLVINCRSLARQAPQDRPSR